MRDNGSIVQKAMRSNKEASRCLQTIAEAQAGFFTAKQAQSAGFSSSSHTYHVREGNWARVYRGIYRLGSFPAVLRPELARWHLWSMNRHGRPQGVYSYFTALDLYLMPETRPLDRHPDLHMTVPTSFRRSGETPEGLALHYADLPESDIAARTGYRLTTPLRTILDLAAANAISREALSKALLQIAERGLITRGQIKSARIPEVSRLQLEALLEWKKR
jgi:hypothetical protein